MSSIRSRTSIAAITTALIGAVLVGQATAGIRPDDRSGARSSGFSSQVANPDAVDRAVANHKASLLRPDDRSGIRSSGPSRQVGSRDAVDRVVANHKARLALTARSTSVSPAGEGFDWGAAGIGASMISTLLLLAGSGLAVVRRTTRRKRPLGSSL